MIKEIIADRLRTRRTYKKMTQKQVAEKLGITESAYGQYEQARRTPAPDVIDTLAALFECTTDYLYGKSDIPHMEEKKSESLLTIKDIRNELLSGKVLEADGSVMTPEAIEQYVRQLDMLIKLRELEQK